MSFVPIRSAHCSRAEWKKERYFFPGSGTLQSKYKLATRNKWSQLDSTRWLSWGGGAIASILTIGPRGPVLYPIKISLSLWARLQLIASIRAPTDPPKKSRGTNGHWSHRMSHITNQPMNQNGSKKHWAVLPWSPTSTPTAVPKPVPSRFLFSFKKSCLAIRCTWSAMTGESFQKTTSTRSLRSCQSRGGPPAATKLERRLRSKDGWLSVKRATGRVGVAWSLKIRLR